MRDSAHAYCQEKLFPRVLEANRHERFDREIMNETETLVLRVIRTIHQRLMHQSLSPNPASPAKAGAHGRHGSRLLPGKLGGRGAESTEWFGALVECT